MGFSAVLFVGNEHPNTILSTYEPLPYAILAIVMMFYLLSGFIADVCYGRLKTVMISLMCLLSCWVVSVMGLLVMETPKLPDPITYTLTHNEGILVIILAFLALFAFIIGLAGYQANLFNLD